MLILCHHPRRRGACDEKEREGGGMEMIKLGKRGYGEGIERGYEVGCLFMRVLKCS